jgi:regulator of sigma E protease
MVHEAGHFIAARKCGVLVEEFAMGMGPRIAGFKKGDTEYSLRLFPIGGFCKMLGEDEAKDDARALNSKPLWKRAVIMFSGAFVNLVFAFIIFFVMAMFVTSISELTVSKTMPGYPAETAGIMPGDRLIRVDGKRLRIYEDLMFALMKYDGRPVEVEVRRGEETVRSTLALRKDDSGDYKIGVELSRKTGIFQPRVEGVPSANLLDTASLGFWQIGFYIKMSIYSIIQMVTLNISMNEVSGPIGIINVIGQVYDETVKLNLWVMIASMLELAGMLSATVGVFNLLPLPALDGGRLLFFAVELIRGRPIEPEKEGMVHFVGFVLLMIFAVFVAFNDVLGILRA